MDSICMVYNRNGTIGRCEMKAKERALLSIVIAGLVIFIIFLIDKSSSEYSELVIIGNTATFSAYVYEVARDKDGRIVTRLNIKESYVEHPSINGYIAIRDSKQLFTLGTEVQFNMRANK